MAKEFFELRPYTDFPASPVFPKAADTKALDRNAKLIMIDPYGFLFPLGDTEKKPPMYFHHAYINQIRFNGVTEFGDTYLEHQREGKHHDEMAQPETPVTKVYERFEDNPSGYVIETEKPYSQIKHYDDGTVTAKETNLIDLTFKPLKYANLDFGCMFQGRYQVQQPCVLTGFYEGKPVIGMGSYDRIYAPEEVFSSRDLMSESAYIYIVGHGIREDGRTEAFMTTIGLYGDEKDGVKNGYYWIDGEEPVVVNNVSIEADWTHLPYVEDGTVVYQKATIHIGAKTIHFNGQWGTKGFTKTPRVERHGQSQVLGDWYEGDIAYRHSLFFGWGEHTGAYDKVIRNMGMKVTD